MSKPERDHARSRMIVHESKITVVHLLLLWVVFGFGLAVAGLVAVCCDNKKMVKRGSKARQGDVELRKKRKL